METVSTQAASLVKSSLQSDQRFPSLHFSIFHFSLLKIGVNFIIWKPFWHYVASILILKNMLYILLKRDRNEKLHFPFSLLLERRLRHSLISAFFFTFMRLVNWCNCWNRKSSLTKAMRKRLLRGLKKSFP